MRLLTIKVFQGAELAFGNHKNIKGRHSFQTVPPELAGGPLRLGRATPSKILLGIVPSFSCCIGVGGPRGSRCSAGAGSTVPSLLGHTKDAGFAGTSDRTKGWKKWVGPNGRPKSSKLMGGAPAQKAQFSQEVVSRQFHGSAKWRGDQANSAFLPELVLN